MNRNIYDTDCITWSPQGRIFQIEYAAEAVKLGTCVVGLRSEEFAVVVGLRRAVSKLASYNNKVLKVDDHCGVACSGITADAVLIVREMRAHCLNYRYNFGAPPPVEDLIGALASRSQKNTQDSGKRPFGVGLLVIGYDRTGSHLFETSPSGDYYEWKAISFGSRCQSAKTFLEANIDDIEKANLQNLIILGIKALATTMPADQELEAEAVHAAVVGKDQPFTILETNEVAAALASVPQAAHP